MPLATIPHEAAASNTDADMLDAAASAVDFRRRIGSLA